jgi:hypothetical protein
MALTGSTTEEQIWNYLISKGLNKYGAAGLMGNLYAESGLKSNNLENLCETRLKQAGKTYCTDVTYTAAVDNGTITRAEFLNPLPNKQYGYGLAQWTSPGRKGGLYDLVKSKKVSIADLETQLEWLLTELKTSYSSVYNTLKTATSVKEASDIVLKKFESPADTGTTMQNTRANYGMKYYNSYATKEDTIVSNTSNYSKYINSTGTHYISNSGHDENNKYKGGSAGDQTGEEWYLRSWYNRPWNCVLRYEKDANVGQKLAELGCAAALNDNIGYDQNERYTYWTQLQKVNYDPSKITVKCESDCSAGVIANTKAVGYLLGISALKNISATYTGDMRSAYKAAGFTVLTDSKYLTGTSYLLPGDILLNDSAHTATNITKGSNASTSTTTTTVENTSYVGKGIGTATAQTEMNIRAQANTSSLVVGTISKGTKVEVLSVSNGWYKIVWSGTSCGYAYTSNTTGTYYSYVANSTTTTSTTTKKTATNAADSKNSSYAGSYQTTADLNIRNGAGTNNSIMVTIPKGTTVQNYGYYSNSNGTPWLYVQFTYNKVVYTGFASKKYLKKV